MIFIINNNDDDVKIQRFSTNELNFATEQQQIVRNQKSHSDYVGARCTF